MKFGKAKIPIIFWNIVIIYLLYVTIFTPNLFITIPVILFPIFAYKLFWIDKQPNVLFFGMMLQFVSASAQLLYCNFLGISIESRFADATQFPADKMAEATILSVIGLYFFSLGIYIVTRKLKFLSVEEKAIEYSPIKVLTIYIGVSMLIYLTSAVIWVFPGLVQFVFFFFYIKWGFFIFCFYIIHKKGLLVRNYFYLFLAAEIVVSTSSFFAGAFLNLTSFTVLSLILLQPKLNPKTYFFILIFTGVLFHFLVIWSAIKGEYRSFLSAGQTTQSVNVSRESANEKLIELYNNLDDQKYKEGLDKFIDRLGYIQFFGAVLAYVPKTEPHQNGEIYLNAVQHYLVPRFLNPNKKVLDDTKHTMKYTGIYLSGMESATSFSIGYVGDAYIDFGPIYMHVLLFAFGALFGVFYKYFIKRSPNVFWQWIFTGPFFLLVNIYGTDTSKALGWVLIYFLTVALARKQLIKRLDPLMRASTN